jgi:hypothetical protein
VTVASPAGGATAPPGAAAAPPATPTATTTCAPNDVVSVVTAADGTVLHTFPVPLEVDFTGASALFVPSTSDDGTTWRRIPELAAPSLPSGQRDGYVRDGTTVRIFTHHLSLFAVAKVTAPTVFGAAVLRGRELDVRVQVGSAAHVTILLLRGGKPVARWLRDVAGARTVRVQVAPRQGLLTVRLQARSDGLLATATVPVRRG